MIETGLGDGRQVTFDLRGKVAVVTGASSGLGVAFANGLAAAGASVVVAGRRIDRLEQTVKSVERNGAAGLAVQADVSDPSACEQIVADGMARFGQVDVLVNNAGIGTAVPALTETPDEFRRVIDVNLAGSYYMAQACARVMRPGSSIVNIGSVLGSTTAGLPQAAYCSSKAAIIGLTRDLAQQWTGRRGVRVNALAPGYFATEMTEQYPDGYLDKVLARVPARRMGRPEEAVDAMLFLASTASSYVTGAVLPVDGGLLTS